jgi:hypothetical protein
MACTFIFAYIFQRERQAGVLALDDAHLSKRSSSDDSQQSEVVQVYCSAVSLCQQNVPRRMMQAIHHCSSTIRRTFAVQIDGLSLAVTH